METLTFVVLIFKELPQFVLINLEYPKTQLKSQYGEIPISTKSETPCLLKIKYFRINIIKSIIKMTSPDGLWW